VVGAQAASAYHHAQLMGKGDYYQEGTLARALPPVTIFLPLLFGFFWGVPLFATECAEGTNRLVWTMGVSRKKWLTVKLAWTLVIAVLYSGIVFVAVMYATRTHNVLFLDRFGTVYLDTEGFMPVVYTLFAVAAGVFLGIWIKRIMPALASLVLLSVIVQVGVGLFARPHYMNTRTADIMTTTTNQNGMSSTSVSTASLGARFS
jgi:ABC-type transport system involved in multi-copper enzyme maturation permease subunit